MYLAASLRHFNTVPQSAYRKNFLRDSKVIFDAVSLSRVRNTEATLKSAPKISQK